MSLKLYQMQILAGALLAAVMEGLVMASRPWPTSGAVDMLEGGSFLLCCAGLMTGGRELRLMFDSKGRDKKAAKSDSAYMRARAHLQIASLVAVAAIGVIVARRWNISWVYPAAGTAALGLSLPIVNRISGWARLD